MSLLFSELIHTQQEVKLFGPAFSSPAIWSVIFQVLHFPGLAFSVAPPTHQAFKFKLFSLTFGEMKHFLTTQTKQTRKLLAPHLVIHSRLFSVSSNRDRLRYVMYTACVWANENSCEMRRRHKWVDHF